MQPLLVLVLIVCAWSTDALVRKRATNFVDHNVVDITDDSEVDYQNYLKEFFPDYKPDNDHEERRKNFMECRQRMLEHDPDEAGYAVGLTHFCHMTNREVEGQWNRGLDESIRDLVPGGQVHQYTQQEVREARDASGLDWRNLNAVSSVKNQLACGSCYTFAAAAALEGAWAIKTGQLLNALTQQYVDCGKHYWLSSKWSSALGKYVDYLVANYSGAFMGCHGGWYHTCWAYNAAVDPERTWECYPYNATESTCKVSAPCKSKKKREATMTVSNFTRVAGNASTIEDAMLTALRKGPLACTLDALHFPSYTGGIVDPVNCTTSANHAITVVGYGTNTTTGQDFWIIKNSWGPRWGDHGYVRLARGKNACGIESQNCAYPNV